MKTEATLDAAPSQGGEHGTLVKGARSIAFQRIPPTRASAPWLLFSNSLLTSSAVWAAQVADLRGRAGLVLYDQAGHGRSSTPTGTVGFDLLSDDLLSVLDAAGVETCCGVGLSMGVPTVLGAYAKAPKRFAALVLMDGQAKTAAGGAAAWAERMAAAQAQGLRPFCEALVGRWMPHCADAALRARLVEMMAATPMEGFLACASALQDYDVSAVLGEISCPVQLVAGALDGTIPDSMARVLLPAIPGARLDVIEGAGHIPCFEQPEAVNVLLARVLQELGT
ncbi:alpha/beta fold hydrolase [Frigidibacter mobilis]|uniref:3-oxoadipate enol-lactonase n=1 Tax=Frigidibacter mobilis TaxID=1335048 RepID=A0A159Z8S2_9RHOB|nr:alpha/beta fold hydrolase [Frigidibacter mobilis]AMY71034.1 3-oxoadipate enol-lactonase [Frigidibacter mobilis]